VNGPTIKIQTFKGKNSDSDAGVQILDKLCH